MTPAVRGGFEALLPGPTKARGMSEGPDARVEAGIAILSTLVFIAILVAAGTMSEGFGETGAYGVITAVVVFILVMAGVGYWLSGKQGE